MTNNSSNALGLYEALTLVGIFLGPIIAVAITLWYDHIRKQSDAQINVLKMLLNTRHLPADPVYSIAINLVPVEFNKQTKIMSEWRNYIEKTRQKPSLENEGVAFDLMKIHQTKLIYEIMKHLKYNLSETDIQSSSYISDGFITRDNLYLDSLKAMRDIADNLKAETAANQ
ncbi:hypothetical protein OVA03_04920 [Asticcacaulis sp. SL142]|uniref:DUF6680 family protein n=1 Tax=Asticcacaulis sp. SL142 TaxID=2995155 RepID=UPI00226D25DD|nr:DUF6680 family protein [Asticcacaulis sp. SL142]WAC49253.1 hypothetical protein OVA03_04920 [Asticcacaulis sp. SL142]